MATGFSIARLENKLGDTVGDKATIGYSNVGSESPFITVTDFLQEPMGDFIIVDGQAHCLRRASLKKTLVVGWVGVCGKSGYKDAKGPFALFDYPYNIIRDSKFNRTLLTELINRKLRAIDWNGEVTTLFDFGGKDFSKRYAMAWRRGQLLVTDGDTLRTLKITRHTAIALKSQRLMQSNLIDITPVLPSDLYMYVLLDAQSPSLAIYNAGRSTLTHGPPLQQSQHKYYCVFHHDQTLYIGTENQILQLAGEYD